MIDAKRIEEMKRLASDVLEGPWRVEGGWNVSDPDYVRSKCGEYVANSYFIDEIEFIAESRQFVPDIIVAYEAQAVEIAKLRKALEYYADDIHYDPYFFEGATCDVTEDGGYIAREALNRKERIL